MATPIAVEAAVVGGWRHPSAVESVMVGGWSGCRRVERARVARWRPRIQAGEGGRHGQMEMAMPARARGVAGSERIVWSEASGLTDAHFLALPLV